MKLFIWNNVDGMSFHYHDDGGLVVIADNLERARELIAEETKEKYDDRRGPCEALTQTPDLIRECEGPEYYAGHPNAGCC